MSKVVYISGPTGVDNYISNFKNAEAYLLGNDEYEIINPANLREVLNDTATHEDYMDVCKMLMPKADAIYLLKGWEKSARAREELMHFLENGKEIMLEHETNELDYNSKLIFNYTLDKFKDRLKEALSSNGIRAIELSEKTGIPKAAISQYISGYAKPKQDRAYLISKVLGISPAWLMGYDVMNNNKDKTKEYSDDSYYKKIFSNNLKRIMSIRQKTQTDLMRDLHLSCSTVSGWANGITLPRMQRIQMLADYLQVEKTDLLEESEVQ